MITALQIAQNRFSAQQALAFAAPGIMPYQPVTWPVVNRNTGLHDLLHDGLLDEGAKASGAHGRYCPASKIHSVVSQISPSIRAIY